MIGKAGRLGLTWVRPSKPAKALKAPPVARAPHQNAGLAFQTRKRGPAALYQGDPHTSPLQKKLDAIRANAAASGAPDQPDSIATSPRPWLERRFGECAYPVSGEGADVMSCCAPSGEATYCPAHHALTHASPPTEAQRRAAANARAAKQMKPSQRARAA